MNRLSLCLRGGSALVGRGSERLLVVLLTHAGLLAERAARDSWEAKPAKGSFLLLSRSLTTRNCSSNLLLNVHDVQPLQTASYLSSPLLRSSLSSSLESRSSSDTSKYFALSFPFPFPFP